MIIALFDLLCIDLVHGHLARVCFLLLQSSGSLHQSADVGALDLQSFRVEVKC